MELSLKTIAVSILLINAACNTGKSVAADQNEQEMKQSIESDYSGEGFTKVLMTGTKSVDCPFILVMDGSNEKLDPVNLEDEKFSIDKKEGASIWIKFQRLRRANRCPEANPVQILEVKQ